MNSEFDTPCLYVKRARYALSACLWLLTGCAATSVKETESYTIPISANLDIERTSVEIKSSKEAEQRLRELITNRFLQAGLADPFRIERTSNADAILRFTQQLVPVDVICPGKVFYFAQRELVEPVSVLRNNERMIAPHWGTFPRSEIRDPVPLGEMLENLDSLIATFIYNYKLGKAVTTFPSHALHRRQASNHTAANQRNLPHEVRVFYGDTIAQTGALTVLQEEIWGSLHDLDLRAIYFPQGAEHYSEYKTLQSELVKAGIQLLTSPLETVDASNAGKLYVVQEIEPLPICAGNVLYRSGIILREKVVVERNELETWADTWGTYQVQIRPSLTESEISEDQVHLIRLFIDDWRKSTPLSLAPPNTVDAF